MGVIENPLTVAAEEKAAAEKTAAEQAAQSGQPVQNSVPITPPTPTPPTPPTQSAVDTEAKAVATSLQDRIGNWLKDVYDSNKFLFYTIIPVMGLIYVVIKYHNLLIDILVKSSGQELKQEQATDNKLAQQANTAKAQADALTQQANNLPKQEGPVDPDWDKK